MNGNALKQSTRRLFNDCCVKNTPKSSGKLTVFGKILIGGTSAVSLALRCNRFVVSCQANRLAGLNVSLYFLTDFKFISILLHSLESFAFNTKISFYFSGYQTKAIKNESIAFDWHKFWTYLKPYLLKFLGAIAVGSQISSCVTYKIYFTCNLNDFN